MAQRLDVVVLRPPVPGAGISHGVVRQERIVVALPSDSRLSEQADLTSDDFADERMVGYPEYSPISQAIAARLPDHNLRQRGARWVFETSALISLVAAGIRPALVPESAMSLNLAGTVYRKIPNASVAQLAIAWRANNRSRSAERFVSFFENVIRDMRGDST